MYFFGLAFESDNHGGEEDIAAGREGTGAGVAVWLVRARTAGGPDNEEGHLSGERT